MTDHSPRSRKRTQTVLSPHAGVMPERNWDSVMPIPLPQTNALIEPNSTCGSVELDFDQMFARLSRLFSERFDAETSLLIEMLNRGEGDEALKRFIHLAQGLKEHTLRAHLLLRDL